MCIFIHGFKAAVRGYIRAKSSEQLIQTMAQYINNGRSYMLRRGD